MRGGQEDERDLPLLSRGSLSFFFSEKKREGDIRTNTHMGNSGKLPRSRQVCYGIGAEGDFIS